MGGSVADEDEAVLSKEEQYHRPPNSAFRQQTIKSWNPYLDPVWCIITFLIIGAIFVPVGYYILKLSDEVVELKMTYDSIYPEKITPGLNNSCSIDKANADKDCNVTFVVPKDMKPPVLLHYYIENFHQNHRDYVFSVDYFQLKGIEGGEDTVQRDLCKPLDKVKNNNNQTIYLSPCGLPANTLFNDIITLTDIKQAQQASEEGDNVFDNDNTPSNLLPELMETGIAWESDIKWKYAQPESYRDALCDIQLDQNEFPGQCDPNCCATTDSENGRQEWTCLSCLNNGTCLDFAGTSDDNNATNNNSTPQKRAYFDPTTKKCYKFYYPNEKSTQYLYETYPKVVPPIEGVLNEHFIVWMRIAALPKFRKLYGYFEQAIPAGTELTFTINNNWNVKSFNGTKSLILSTNNIFGSKNDYMGISFVGIGYFCLTVGILFGLKHFIKPRKIGHPKYLRYDKED